MILTTGELIGVIFITAIASFGISAAIFYNIFKCTHEWEKLIDTCGRSGRGRVVVHMCKKCGKRKITKV